MAKRKKKKKDNTRYGEYKSTDISYDAINFYAAIYGLISSMVIAYITYSWVNDRAAVITNRKVTAFGYMEGEAMYVFFIGLLLLLVRLWLPLVETYKRHHNFRRKNQISKRLLFFKRWLIRTTWVVFILSVILGIMNGSLLEVHY